MKFRGQHWTARKPGWQPPERLLELLRLLHPRVRLVYSPRAHQWAMLQLVDGQWKWITAIEGIPTVRNTVHELNSMRITSLADVERLEERLDGQGAALEAAARAAAHDRIEEGHDRMWHELGSSHTVQVPASLE